jgi:RNA ligase
VLQPPVNENYCATVFALDRFVDLPNCANVKHAIIQNAAVVVGKDEPAGRLGLFFPVETALSAEFLAANNLYREATLNADPTKRGFFEENGRVKAVRFRGHKSEGFWIPLEALSYITSGGDEQGVDLALMTSFDRIGKHEICRKYFSRRNPGKLSSNQTAKEKLVDTIVRGQFAFHPDTPKLARHIEEIRPSDYIVITDKWHGTSAVFGRLLVKKKLNIFLRALAAVGVPVQTTQYEDVWSSRKVVKGVGAPKDNVNHYYASDVWGDVFERVRPAIPDGYTLYGEIVGYTKDGKPIQAWGDKVWAYGCAPGVNQFFVYRVTYTPSDSPAIELSWDQMVAFLQRQGLQHLPVLYRGLAGGFLPGETDPKQWNRLFMASVDRLVQNRPDIYNPGLPAEGVVIRVEDGACPVRAYKCKSFDFLEGETKALDMGQENMEDEEGSVDENRNEAEEAVR